VKTVSEENQDESEILLDQALLEFMRRSDSGRPETRDKFVQEYPEIAPQLEKLLAAADWIENMAGPTLAELADSQSVPPVKDNETVDPNAATIAPTPSGFLFRPAYQSQSISIDESTLPPLPANSASARTAVRGDYSLASIASLDGTASILPYRFGDYVLEKVLGRGGMGVVYLAFQVQLERRVALKMIRSGALASEDEVNRFYTEARSAASLTHPNIVTVYHCGEIEGHHFFSMDFVPGTDLAKLLESGNMPPREAVRYVRDVARAIDYAHQQGVVHRDLKPANVLIDEQDQVVVTDFGLAKQMNSEAGLTATGAALGTPSYMSPEQASGKSEEQGASTDVYAIGAILYALLTGKPPFQGESVLQTMMQVMNRPAPTVRSSNPNIHVDLDTIVTKCLEKSPARRYSSARELAEDLDRFYQGIPIAARPPSFVRRTKYWFMHVPLVAALAGVRNVEPTRSQRIAQNVMIAVAVCLLTLWLTGGSFFSAWRDQTLPSQLTIASGPPGGMYYELAGKLAERIHDRSDRDSKVMATKGSLENLKQLEDHRVQLALMQESSFRADQISVVAPLFYEAVHIMVPKHSSVQHVDELRGKRIAMGAKDSGTRQASVRLLKHFGITAENSNFADDDWTNAEHLKKVDGVIAVTRVGQSSIMELVKEHGFRLLPLDNASAVALAEPMLRLFEIPKGTYSDTEANTTQTLATIALLVVRRDAPSRLVEECMKVLYEKSQPSDGFIPLELAANWQGLSYHEAARRYFARTEGVR
jgi:eukaryotic-like serine/threonine-protein kinase